jgi:hypothetical protein
MITVVTGRIYLTEFIDLASNHLCAVRLETLESYKNDPRHLDLLSLRTLQLIWEN